MGARCERLHYGSNFSIQHGLRRCLMSQNFKLLADAITPFYDINFSPYTARVQTESGDKLKVYIT